MARTLRLAPPALLRAVAVVVAAAVAVTVLGLLAGCAGPASAQALVGVWGSTAAKQPNLTIESDGAFSGTDGCNRLSGRGSIDGDTITFGAIARTMMACQGVDEWLVGAATGTAKGRTLTVHDRNGSTIGTLHKSM